jgi:hypothetical protein
MCVYGARVQSAEIALAWMVISRRHGWEADFKGQHVEPVFDATGWLKYVGKHSARGVDHYQRERPPEGWETTGRLWGTGGDWPVREPFVVNLRSDQAHRYKALMAGWQAARMRREGVLEERIAEYVAGTIDPRTGGNPRGMSGWIPYAESVKLLMNATEMADNENKEIECQ